MIPFQDRPIRQKLMLLIIVITSAALLLSGVMLVGIDALLFHDYLVRDLSTFSRVIADNSTASLAFDDPRSATEILVALRARPHVVAACLARQDGSQFAHYLREGAAGACRADLPRRDSIASTLQAVTITRAVMLKNEQIGTLAIVYDLGEVIDRIRIWGATVLGVLILSCLSVVLLSSRLRTMFVTPILELASVTAAVSRTRDYAMRAEQRSADEVGQLAGTFNEMLAGIERRDAELRTTLLGREQALDRLASVNRQLQRSNEELARSNQDLERFAFIASHDMQEPLRMVTIYSQLLVKECGEVKGDLLTYRDYIVSGTARMRELIADLLAYIEITMASPDPRTVDLNAVIEKVKHNLSLTIDESGATIDASPLPQVNGHEAQLVSLFQNLISNAIKYRGDRPPMIRIAAERRNGETYQFAVSDRGIGIEPQYHAQIFVAFKRLHGKSIQGTGIGLAICQRIVERYGGRIWVESEVGKGASFRFTLPAAGAATASPQAGESSAFGQGAGTP